MDCNGLILEGKIRTVAATTSTLQQARLAFLLPNGLIRPLFVSLATLAAHPTTLSSTGSYCIFIRLRTPSQASPRHPPTPFSRRRRTVGAANGVRAQVSRAGRPPITDAVVNIPQEDRSSTLEIPLPSASQRSLAAVLRLRLCAPVARVFSP